jgi:hypothetical protein
MTFTYICMYTKFNKDVEEQNDVNCDCEKEGMNFNFFCNYDNCMILNK